MDILDKIDKVMIDEAYGKPKAGGGSTLVYWELCDPKTEEDDGCQEIEVDIQWYWSPEEKDVGYSGGLEIDGGAVISSPFTFMGKTYRAKQDFPKALQKYLYDYKQHIKRAPSRHKSWDAFLEYEVERADKRW